MNVVVILADDLGWADLGCYGNKYHKTPNIDRLAAAGVRFTDAYAASPVCSPSRRRLLTGKYPVRMNLTDWLTGRPDRPDQKLLRPTLAAGLPDDVLAARRAVMTDGYQTGLVGKWHLGGKGQHAARPRLRRQRRRQRIRLGGQLFRTVQGPKRVPRWSGWRTTPARAGGKYLTDRLTAEAEKFFDANKERPFFLYLAHYAPHIPLKAKADLVAKYKSGKPGEQVQSAVRRDDPER